MMVMGIDALSDFIVIFSIRLSILCMCCMRCCISVCMMIAKPPWRMPIPPGAVLSCVAADVMLLYPFLAKSRSCGICVSCIAVMCIFCFISSCSMSCSYCVLIRLSGLMLAIVSVFVLFCLLG